MPEGPGKYDDLCTLVREKAKARGVLVAIIDGEYGQGFSVQGEPDCGREAARDAGVHGRADETRQE